MYTVYSLSKPKHINMSVQENGVFLILRNYIVHSNKDINIKYWTKVLPLLFITIICAVVSTIRFNIALYVMF